MRIRDHAWPVVSTALLKRKDISRSQAVKYTESGNMSETVQDADVVTTDR